MSLPSNQINPNLAGGKRSLALAGSSRLELGALTVLRLVNTLVLLADVADIRSTGAADAGGIAVVGVDSNQGRDAGGFDVLDDDVAGALALVVAAVAAGAVQLAGVDNGESVNGDGSGTVVLNDLVAGFLGATTLDEGVSGSDDGDGVL
jgi:hypothetical protein